MGTSYSLIQILLLYCLATIH